MHSLTTLRQRTYDRAVRHLADRLEIPPVPGQIIEYEHVRYTLNPQAVADIRALQPSPEQPRPLPDRQPAPKQPAYNFTKPDRSQAEPAYDRRRCTPVVE